MNPHKLGENGDSSHYPLVLDPVRRNPSRETLLLVRRFRLHVDRDLPDGLLANDAEELPCHHGVWQPERLERIRLALEFAQDTQHVP